MSTKLYRVTVKTTNSVQPGTTFWQTEMIYCGDDRDDARVAYHSESVTDYWRGYGNAARETVVEVIDDAGTDSFADDFVESYYEED